MHVICVCRLVYRRAEARSTIRYLACGDLENIIYRDSTGSKWIKKDQVRVPPRLVLRKGRERVL